MTLSCICVDHDNDVVCMLKRNKANNKIRKLHYSKEVIKSTLQTVIQ